MRMSPSDVVWMPSPVGHSTGFNYGIRVALYHGLKLVLQDQWNAQTAVDLIEREGCSYTLAATTFLKDVVEEANRRGRKLPTMSRFGCGGAPVPPELVEAALQCDVQVLRLYGSTEVLVGTWNRPGSPLGKRQHTDGNAMSHVEVELRTATERFAHPGLKVRFSPTAPTPVSAFSAILSVPRPPLATAGSAQATWR
jgi:acyl-coenzyme A synthetase/AMP-(fatty) acid ligase